MADMTTGPYSHRRRMVGDFPLARHGRRARDDGSPGSVSQSVLAQPGDLTEAGRERERERKSSERKEGRRSEGRDAIEGGETRLRRGPRGGGQPRTGLRERHRRRRFACARNATRQRREPSESRKGQLRVR